MLMNKKLLAHLRETYPAGTRVELVRMDDGIGNLAHHHCEEGRGQNAARNRIETGHSQIPERQILRTLL